MKYILNDGKVVAICWPPGLQPTELYSIEIKPDDDDFGMWQVFIRHYFAAWLINLKPSGLLNYTYNAIRLSTFAVDSSYRAPQHISRLKPRSLPHRCRFLLGSDRLLSKGIGLGLHWPGGISKQTAPDTVQTYMPGTSAHTTDRYSNRASYVLPRVHRIFRSRQETDRWKLPVGATSSALYIMHTPNRARTSNPFAG